MPEKCFGSKHIGGKSKEALAQELFSLFNQEGMIKTKKERIDYKSHLAEAEYEWIKRFGSEDYKAFWNRTFKGKKD